MVVATDSLDVANAVSGLATVWVDSNDDSWCGTQRTSRALAGLPANYADDAHVVVSWQADEPEIDPDWVDNLITHVSEFSHGFEGDPQVWTMTAPLRAFYLRKQADVVKAITDQHPTEHYTRVTDFARNVGHAPDARHHVGIYAMRPEQLAELVAMPPSTRAIAEALEQLTWIDDGWEMATVHIPRAPRGINTTDDYRQFCFDHWSDNHQEPSE